LKAKLESFLGFLHSVQYSKPSLICDLEELYRYLVDDFMFEYLKGLKPNYFTTMIVKASKSRKGKREYLNDTKTRTMIRELYDFFGTKVELPLISYGKWQRIETLINEEALLMAKYIRNESGKWVPRLYQSQVHVQKIDKPSKGGRK